jgi:hypothetical protein
MALNDVLETYHRWRRKTLPPSISDLQWRFDALGRRMESLEQTVGAHLPPPVATAEAQTRVREALRLLRPRAVVGYDKVRIGSAGDGGYVQIDDLDGVVHALSFGVCDNDSWDLAMAQAGVPVEQFDHSIETAPSTHPLLTFHRKMITLETTDSSASLPDLVAQFSKGGADLILKMDIEGWEWDVLDRASDADLSRIAQILCEFHHLSRLVQPEFAARAKRVFEKLSRQFAPVHFHANNCGPLCNTANVPLPDYLEITFVNRERYETTDSDELFPTPLDAPNDPRYADIFLGAFRF